MVYQYLAYNERGQIVTGKLAASDEDTATETLRYAGYRTVSLKPRATLISLDNILPGLVRVRPNEVIILYRQLATLVEAGINYSMSLEILQKQTDNSTLKKTLGEIISEVRGGGQLSSAISKYPKIFSLMHSRLISIGERSGNLETILRLVADDMEKEVASAKETKNALMYPIITLVVALVVIGVLLTFVMPPLSKLYISLGIELPRITRIMMAISNVLRNNSLFIVAAAFGMVLFTSSYIKTKRGRYNWDKLLLRIPLLGRIRHLLELAHCSRSLSMLYGAGLPLTEVIPLVIESCSNKVIAESFSTLHKRMVQGEGLAGPMSGDRIFLPLMVQMVRIGERTGILDNALLSVSNSYSLDVENRLRYVISLIQPAMTIFIGLIVALIALSMTSALYGIYQTGF